MDKKSIFLAIQKSVLLIMDGVDEKQIQKSDSLKSLGANSIDRAEIIMLTLENLNIRIPMIDFAQAKNIDDICNIIYDKYQTK
tara:strand:+ start:62513 stop:62761 length:249 start_codon:yes stop_codon:yes gene_type:complete